MMKQMNLADDEEDDDMQVESGMKRNVGGGSLDHLKYEPEDSDGDDVFTKVFSKEEKTILGKETTAPKMTNP